MGDRLATIGKGRKWRKAAVGGWVSIQHNKAWAKAYLFTKWHLDPSNSLVTTVGMLRSTTYKYAYGLFLSLA